MENLARTKVSKIVAQNFKTARVTRPKKSLQVNE